MATSTATLDTRALALPTEHGGWGLLLEPVVLGLLVAPSAAGTAFALAAAGAFLARHPARLVWSDWRRSAWYPRTGPAALIAGAYSAAAVLGLGIALAGARGPLLSIVLLSLPAAGVYLAYDLRLRSREWLAELAGAAALSSSAAGIAAAAGWPLA